MDVTPDALVSLRDKKVRSVIHFVCTEKISMATVFRIFATMFYFRVAHGNSEVFHARIPLGCFYVYMFIYIIYVGCLVLALYGAGMFRNFSLETVETVSPF